MASTIEIIRGLPGIAGIKYDPHDCQHGWTTVSVWLDLFSNWQLTVMWIQVETTYRAYQASAPAAGIRDSNVVMPHGRQKKAIYRGRIYFYGLGKELTLIAAPRWTAP